MLWGYSIGTFLTLFNAKGVFIVSSSKHRMGFTIVELLIVIVVIAILAALSIVAYTGIQNRANDTAVQSDIRNLTGKVREIARLPI